MSEAAYLVDLRFIVWGAGAIVFFTIVVAISMCAGDWKARGHKEGYANGVAAGVRAERARTHELARLAVARNMVGGVPFSIHGADVLRGLLREIDDETSEERYLTPAEVERLHDDELRALLKTLPQPAPAPLPRGGVAADVLDELAPAPEHRCTEAGSEGPCLSFAPEIGADMCQDCGHPETCHARPQERATA